MDSDNLNPPFLGQTFPDYPPLPQIVFVTGPKLPGTNPGIYPCIVQQLNPATLQFRSREAAYVVEPNNIALGPAYYDCRLVGAYQGPGNNSPIPLYATSCCAVGSFSSSSSSSTTPISVPAAPTGLTATPGLLQVVLTWNPTPSATSYNLYRSSIQGGEGETPYQTGLTGTTFTDASLTSGIRLYYQLTAVNAAGESPRTEEVSAVPLP